MGVIKFCDCGFSSLMAMSSNNKDGVAEFKPIVVLELFTSQGCSSCPPADKLLSELKSKKIDGVYTLSYHVDYWDHLGWRDPFSKAIYAQRQRKYGKKFQQRSIYTPQVVVNGSEHFVGSNVSELERVLGKYSKNKVENEIAIENLAVEGRVVQFECRVLGSVQDKRVRALLLLDERATKVGRGENRSKLLTSSNIVIDQTNLTILNGKTVGQMVIPDYVNSSEKLMLVLLVEDTSYNITAATEESIAP